jgi:hypothetical protein
MAKFGFSVAMALIGAVSLAHAETPPPDAATKPAAAKPAATTPSPNDPSALSGDFWGDWKKTKASDAFGTLKTQIGIADKTKATTAATKPGQQPVVDVAVQRPEEAAKMLSSASAATGDTAQTNALATVVSMVTTPQTREAAIAYVEPEEKARVETMAANLTTGIQGLPGIYLGDVEQSAPRASVPSGYTPVSGGSMGCPTR